MKSVETLHNITVLESKLIKLEKSTERIDRICQSRIHKYYGFNNA